MRAEWGAAPGRKVILLPGRMSRTKGHAVLIEALARLGGDSMAVMIGGGGQDSYRAEMTSLAERLGVIDRLRLLGHVAAVPAAMLAADVVVQAAIEREAFGRTILEAQAMGRPVIATDVGGPRESIEQGVTGWLVPPNDVSALAAAIAEVLAMPEAARDAFGRTARCSVLRDRTTAVMQAATIAVYRELLP
jgi:glycosyltransferase involved in cell wall biosynthesis